MFGDLTTLSDVKAWLSTGQAQMPPTDDALLSRLITAASNWIQTWLNRAILSQDWIETRDGTGGDRMVFGAFPVTAVLGLTIDGIVIPPAPPPSPSTGLTAGYVFSPTELAVRGYRFWRRAQNVVITYTAGYRTVPPDLAQACIDLVALRYRERSRVGEVSKHIGGETVSYSQRDMPANMAVDLKKYQLVVPVSGFLVQASTQFDTATLVAAA